MAKRSNRGNRIVAFAGLLWLALLLYMFLWPVPIDPAVWEAPTAPPLEGDYAVNSVLATIERLGEGFGTGPEDLALDEQGRVYTGYVDGRVVRFDGDGANPEVLVNTGGRPLGLDFDASGNLIIADADKGLLSLAPDGTLTTLTTEEGGVPFGFTDDVDIAPNGTIYFTDASFKFHKFDSVTDIVENQPNGRLLAYHPDTGQTELVLGGLHFANGVAMGPGGDYLLLTETARYRIYRVWLTDERRYESEVFADNLPGFPDNITFNGSDIFWVALYSPRKAIIDKTADSPMMRKMMFRLPAAMRPQAVRYSFVLGLAPDGSVVHNLQDPAGVLSPITSVNQRGNTLYLGSLTEPAFGRFELP